MTDTWFQPANPDFVIVLRGYDRNGVGDYLQRMGAALAATAP